MNNEDKPSNNTDTPTDLKYKGPDRRKSKRRKGTDRRDEARFDLDSEDQRKDRGRRKDDNTF